MAERSGRRGSEQTNVLLVNDDGPDAADQRKSQERRGFLVTRTSDTDAGLAIARQTQPHAIFLSARALGIGAHSRSSRRCGATTTPGTFPWSSWRSTAISSSSASV